MIREVLHFILYMYSKLVKKIQIASVKNSLIDRTSKVSSRTNIISSSIGRYSYFGSDCKVVHAEIGNFCSIGDGVRIGAASHPMDWVSTSPIFCSGNNILGTNFAKENYEPYTRTTVQHDVWIGDGAFIKSGLMLSTGAIIGMGAVVTKNVGPYEIWAGNPARLVRKRFDDDTIAQLLASEWFLKQDTEIASLAHLFSSPHEFVKAQSRREL